MQLGWITIFFKSKLRVKYWRFGVAVSPTHNPKASVLAVILQNELSYKRNFWDISLTFICSFQANFHFQGQDSWWSNWILWWSHYVFRLLMNLPRRQISPNHHLCRPNWNLRNGVWGRDALQHLAGMTFINYHSALHYFNCIWKGCKWNNTATWCWTRAGPPTLNPSVSNWI